MVAYLVKNLDQNGATSTSPNGYLVGNRWLRRCLPRLAIGILLPLSLCLLLADILLLTIVDECTASRLLPRR
ncbi:uncharacterized protein DS421_3g72270 [Arachis hypogaea]|nr:uncharacterized protein DS421_3g72270 [Arachis hypogaea]